MKSKRELFRYPQFRTHSTSSSVPPLVRSARRGLSGIECRPVQCVQRPGVCGSALASGTAYPAACDVQPVPVRWKGQGLTGGGIQGEPGAGWSVPQPPKKQKKTHPTFTNQNPSDCASLQKFQKTKRPLTEPRLCYNQLKEKRQRKEESKMRKRIAVAVLMAALACIALVGC